MSQYTPARYDRFWSYDPSHHDWIDHYVYMQHRFHPKVYLLHIIYEDHGGPGEPTVYHSGYYGALVLDRDGHNVEVVNHNR